MNLTEGQLFTIEALNKIEGFVWPDGAKFAEVDGGCIVYFYESDSTGSSPLTSARVKGPHDKRKINASITREQFDNVDGWVRNDGNEPVISGDFEVMFRGSSVAFDLIGVGASELNWKCPCDNGDTITHWRYNKQNKETEMKDDEEFSLPIGDVYLRYKAQRETTADARKVLEASMEAEDKLLDQIKAWNLEYGFDIRALDESDEAPDVEPNPEPELVITDWRDLRIGDEIMIGPYLTSRGDIISVDHVNATARPANGFPPVTISDVSPVVWKFIRRPSK